jgi:hypothetical protein
MIKRAAALAIFAWSCTSLLAPAAEKEPSRITVGHARSQALFWCPEFASLRA